MSKKVKEEDYEASVTDKGKTVYTYIGPRYSIEGARYALINGFLSILSVGFYLAMGLCDGLGLYNFFVAIPYVVAMLPLCLAVGNAYKLFRKRSHLTRPEYEKGFVRQKTCLGFLSALSLFMLIAEAALLIISANQISNEDWRFLGLGICFFALSAINWRMQLRVTVLVDAGGGYAPLT